MKNEEYELVLFAWDTPLRPQAEERNLSSPKGGTGGGLFIPTRKSSIY